MSETTHDLTRKHGAACLWWKSGETCSCAPVLPTHDLTQRYEVINWPSSAARAVQIPNWRGPGLIDIPTCSQGGPITTHDLTQRAEKFLEANEDPAYAEPARGCDLVRDLSAALVQAEQEKASKEAMLAAIIGVVPNAPTHLQFADFIMYLQRLASQEATIRQLVEAMRNAGSLGIIGGAAHQAIDQWADTLATLLPAEPTKESLDGRI